MAQHVTWCHRRGGGGRQRRWWEIELNGIGKLTSPALIAAFEGWNDAGEAASGVIDHLGSAWQAAPVGAIDPEDYYDFQVTGPVMEIAEGRAERLVWPTTRLSLAKPDGLGRDVVLVHGIEPNMRWRAFREELISSFTEMGIEARERRGFVHRGHAADDGPLECP